jgi:hypothetical protein
MNCDFCGAETTKEELLVVPTRPFAIPEISFRNESWGWGACGLCATYIRDLDWDGLLDRAVKNHAQGEQVRLPLELVYFGVRMHQNGPVRGWDEEIDNKET